MAKQSKSTARGRPRHKRRTPRDEAQVGDQRPAAEELGGESEYSLEEAHHIERGSTRRHAPGAYEREPLNPRPDATELGRRYLENATQAPVDPHPGEEENLVLPSDER